MSAQLLAAVLVIITNEITIIINTRSCALYVEALHCLHSWAIVRRFFVRTLKEKRSTERKRNHQEEVCAWPGSY